VLSANYRRTHPASSDPLPDNETLKPGLKPTLHHPAK